MDNVLMLRKKLWDIFLIEKEITPLEDLVFGTTIFKYLGEMKNT